MATAERKSAAAGVASDDGTYEVTAHGRRRVSRVPKFLLRAWGLISWPIRAVHRRLYGTAARP
jgi:hypothetical protein